MSGTPVPITDLLIHAEFVRGLASVPIPNSLALVGATFHHQHIPCELDVGGALVSMRATNALSATIGDS